MRRFADLYDRLDSSTKTLVKVDAMRKYFAEADPASAAWALYFLSGRKPRQVVPSKLLRQWANERAGLSEWLFDESYHAVGDIAETITLLLPGGHESTEQPLHWWVEQKLLPLRNKPPEEQKAEVGAAWDAMNVRQRFIWNKLITGGLRVGVSQQLVMRSLAENAGLETPIVAHRLMGEWEPTAEFFLGLLGQDAAASRDSQPYPFYLAHPIDGDPAALGDVADWQAEWKWDGIRSQLIRRKGRVYLWSRGEELVTDRYPELKALGESLPDGTVVDGEILPWKDGAVLPFAKLQQRIGRKTLGKKILDDVPVVIVAYDLIEWQGQDIRTTPLVERRKLLEDLTALLTLQTRWVISPTVTAASWEEFARQRLASRSRQVEGLMLKRKNSAYGTGRVRGDWWKWKVEPLTVDAVLVNAQRGSGKRASVYSDYTFAVWDDAGKLVPFAKAYSGLTDAEMRVVDAFVRKNTTDKFGPVRAVKPELVFELGFEGINESTRHKSGVAVRFPRILRQRTDKKPGDADTLAKIRAMLRAEARPDAKTGRDVEKATEKAEQPGLFG